MCFSLGHEDWYENGAYQQLNERNDKSVDGILGIINHDKSDPTYKDIKSYTFNQLIEPSINKPIKKSTKHHQATKQTI